MFTTIPLGFIISEISRFKFFLKISNEKKTS